MFSREPIRTVDGIHDFLLEEDSYVENYERIAADDLDAKIMPDEVKDVLLNCCELLTHGETVVDVGSAYGHIIGRIKAKRRIAVDISLRYLREVPKEVVAIRANGEDIPLVDAIADSVICTDVFEHVVDETALASELTRILKPGGNLMLATPWCQDLSVYDSQEYKSRFKKYEFTHLRSVNNDMIRACFPSLSLLASTTITIGMKHMELKPYPIRFMHFVKDHTG